ncbi:hypothetical protein ACW2Q0_28185 [Nocardia sp. R16R-3T]
MTQPFAEAHVSAILDWNNLDEELTRRVTEAAEEARKTLQGKLDKWSLSATVKLKPSVGEFRKLAREKLAEITIVKDVELRTTAAELNKWTRDLRDRLNRKTFHVNVTPRLDMTQLNAKLANLPEGTAKVNLTVTAAERNRFALWLRAWLAGIDFTASVRADLTNAAAFRAQMDALTQDRTVDVNARMRGGLGGLGGLGKNLSVPGLATMATDITKGAAAMALLGGAAGTALGAVGALGVGLAALGPAAIAGIATVTVGLSGMKDAFSALSAAEDSSASDATAQAQARVTAERGVRDAKKNSLQAEQDLTRARKDAQKQMRDLNVEVRGGVISEAEAQLDLRDARKDLANLKPGDDYERAQIRVAKAEQSLIETRYRNNDLAEKQQDVNAKGVEGSDLVTAAKDRQTAAEERLADAQAALTQAMSGSSSAQDKAAQALAKLAPEARAFALTVQNQVKPAFAELVGQPTQNALFAGSAEGIKQLTDVMFPVLGRGMTGVATQINGLTKDFAEFWKAPENLGAIESIFSGTAGFISGLGPGLKQATTGLLSIGQAFEPVAAQIGASVGNLAGSIMQPFTDAFASGALTQLISNFGSILDGLGAGLQPLIGGLIQIGNLVGPYLGPFFAQLGASLAQLAGPLGNLGATFLQTITPLLPVVSGFASQLLTAVQPLLPILGQIAGSLLSALQPAIGPLSQIAQVVGGALAQALTALAPSMGPLTSAFASLISAVAPIVPVVAEVVSGLIQALAPALKTIFDALGPVITQWADLMMPVFTQLQPIIADVAMKIADALVGALNQLAPYLPDIAKSFGDLITAIAPLLPQLIDIGATLLPPLLDLFIAILPQLLKLIDAFTWLVSNVIEPLVLPALQKMADDFGSQLQFAADAVNTARDVIGGALSKIGEFFTGLGSTASDVWGLIVRTIKSAVREIGKFLVGLPEMKIPDLPGVPGRGTTVGFAGIGRSMIQWAGAEGMAAGGRLIRGPGTGTSDSIPALLDGMRPLRVANGEFISTADAYERGAPLLWALNNGWTPSADFVRMLVNGAPGFAGGGLVTADELVRFAQGVEGAPYDWGGVHWGDCSGAVSALANKATGAEPFGSRFSTANMDSALAAMGAQPGLGPAGSLSFGWFSGGPYGGHTAATLPDGTHFEMGGQRGNGQFGGQAAGADDPSFTDHAHFPPEFFLGGDPGTVGGSSAGSTGQSSRLGGATSGAGTSGSGSGASSSSGSSSSSSSGGGAATDVRVVNWPASWTGSTAQVAQTTAASSSSTQVGGSTGAPVIGATGEPPIPDLNIGSGGPATGIDAANRWAASQDWATKFQDWGIGALKSIVGEVSDPFGLKSLTDQGIDRGAEAIRQQVNLTQNFYGYDPAQVAKETERTLGSRMTPVSETYRAG